MTGSRKRRVSVILFAMVLALGFGGYLARDILFFSLLYPGSRADWELNQLVRRVAKGESRESDESIRMKCFEIAAENPGTRAEVTAYLFILKQWPDTEDADLAYDKLLMNAQDVGIGDFARSLEQTRPGRRGHESLGSERWRPLAVLLIERVRQEPNHPKAARLLCEVAVRLHPDSAVESAPEELIQAAELIQQRYSTSADLANFCEVAGNLGNPVSWTQPFEPYVRHILEVNQHRFVRFSAHLALATIIRARGPNHQEEARKLYEDFLTNFDGETPHEAQSIEQAWRKEVRQILKIMSTHGIGMPAPDTVGVDLDGEPLSLKDYRGRVVLVSFWATWCGPCMRAIPHERELLETFGQSDFAIFGINADEDIAKARAAVPKHGITWRSLRTRQEASSHARNWTVDGYPTFYLLDKQGMIVRSWEGIPPDSELSGSIHDLLLSNNAR